MTPLAVFSLNSPTNLYSPGFRGPRKRVPVDFPGMTFSRLSCLLSNSSEVASLFSITSFTFFPAGTSIRSGVNLWFSITSLNSGSAWAKAPREAAITVARKRRLMFLGSMGRIPRNDNRSYLEPHVWPPPRESGDVQVAAGGAGRGSAVASRVLGVVEAPVGELDERLGGRGFRGRGREADGDGNGLDRPGHRAGATFDGHRLAHPLRERHRVTQLRVRQEDREFLATEPAREVGS